MEDCILENLASLLVEFTFLILVFGIDQTLVVRSCWKVVPVMSPITVQTKPANVCKLLNGFTVPGLRRGVCVIVYRAYVS